MCAAWGGKKMQMMKVLEAALVGHEGIHRLGSAHMPNIGMYAPPAICPESQTSQNDV
jgi:hypothetical protein